MKIVDKPNTKLGADGGRWLRGLIDTSLKKDADYFSFMSNLRNLLTGEHWKNVKGVSKEQIKMVVNLAHAHVRTLVPTLFFQNPSVDCAPTAPMYAGKEQTWNGIINNTLDKTNFAEECKKVVLDAVTYPEGVMKDVRNVASAPTSEANSTGPTVWLSKGAPVHVRIAPAQLIVDYLSTDRDTDNARFIAVRYKKPLQELRLNPLYKGNVEEKVTIPSKTTTGNLSSSIIEDSSDWDSPESIGYGDTDEKLVTIYEVWIHQLVSVDGEYKLYQQMCVLLDGQDKPIRELTPWSEVMGVGFDKFPVTRMVLNAVPDRVPTSELGVWQNMQMSLNWLMSRITQLVENDRQLTLVDPSKIKNMQKFRQQFYSGRTRELVEVTDMNAAVDMIQPTFVGRDNYSLVNLTNQYIQQVSGIGQNRRGGSGIRTATEASLVDEGTRIKTDEKVDIVSKFLIRVMTKNAMITRAIASEAQGSEWVFRIGGDVGSVKWVSFNAEDINWLPEIRIRVNSFRKMDSMQEAQKYAGLINQAMGLFQIYGPTVRVDLLFARMLESAGIYDSGKIIGDQDMQTMLQTVELAGIITGVPTPVLEAHNHAAHLQVIDGFRQSQYGQQIMSMEPAVADRLAQHEQQHIAALQEQQAKAQQAQAQQNPFAAAGMSENSTPQSQALEQTEGDRMAVQSVPGGNGEFA